jgi:hypothetical protein
MGLKNHWQLETIEINNNQFLLSRTALPYSRVSHVAIKALVRLRTFGQFNYVLLANSKIFGSSKIKNGRSIQDGRQNLIYF